MPWPLIKIVGRGLLLLETSRFGLLSLRNNLPQGLRFDPFGPVSYLRIQFARSESKTRRTPVDGTLKRVEQGSVSKEFHLHPEILTLLFWLARVWRLRWRLQRPRRLLLLHHGRPQHSARPLLLSLPRKPVRTASSKHPLRRRASRVLHRHGKGADLPRAL
jgi:hypothetical protein